MKEKESIIPNHIPEYPTAFVYIQVGSDPKVENNNSLMILITTHAKSILYP